ncbi:MAG: hypothetical protein FWC41_03110 [Firmicutes bacterium]|nr:hypothetical protein [Bacillota bacterium]
MNKIIVLMLLVAFSGCTTPSRAVRIVKIQEEIEMYQLETKIMDLIKKET